MDTPSIPQSLLLETLRTLVTVAYLGPPDPHRTWFVDNEAHSGVGGSLDRVSAAEASLVQGYPSGSSIAGHSYHIRFALDLVVKAIRGEPAYETARWSESWARNSVTEQEWDLLRTNLRVLVSQLTDSLTPSAIWNDSSQVTGALAVVAHGAWHLGAVRQLVVRLL